MNNADFRAHFLHFCAYLGLADDETRQFTVIPVPEEGKPHTSADDLLRLLYLPRPRSLSFEGVVRLFTWKEGYYPLWIRAVREDGGVSLYTSLRMRKAGVRDDKQFYPFLAEMPGAH